MKKKILLSLVMVATFAFVACSGKAASTTATEAAKSEAETAEWCKKDAIRTFVTPYLYKSGVTIH